MRPGCPLSSQRISTAWPPVTQQSPTIWTMVQRPIARCELRSVSTCHSAFCAARSTTIGRAKQPVAGAHGAGPRAGAHVLQVELRVPKRLQVLVQQEQRRVEGVE